MRHPFELDPAVIHSIIHHQAGSIGKALIELIMNSVDAGEYTDLMICLQEVRDLVRYTPIAVSLNGAPITKDPSKENWDYQDENAYYRVKPDGPVGIYNQGVLVRNDSSHMWGCGGLVVTKKPIGLNVSRTEILRKTCPVWKAIAAQLKVMADELNGRIGDHRKTEARREQSARALLGGDTDSLRIFGEEEVITLLPGKKHVTFAEFIRRSFSHEKNYAVVERAQDVPKGEAIAREGIALLVHPSTMYRFGCYSAGELRDDLDRIVKTLSLRALKDCPSPLLPSGARGCT